LKLKTILILSSKLYLGPPRGLLFRFPKYAKLSALKMCYQQGMICKLLIYFAHMYDTITHSSHLLTKTFDGEWTWSIFRLSGFWS